MNGSVRQGAPAGDWVLIGAPNTSKVSLLQEASYVCQENLLRRLCVDGQKVLAGAPLSLTGAFIDMARISRNGCITPGEPAVRWPQGAHGLQKGTIALNQGSHRLISLKGALAGDRVLIRALNVSKELSFMRGLICMPRKFATATPHRRSKDFSWSQGTTVIIVRRFVGLKGPLLGSWGSLSNNEIFR